MKKLNRMMNWTALMPVLTALFLGASVPAHAQGTWTNTNYGDSGRVFDVKAMPNGDAWVARAGGTTDRRGPARYSATTEVWNPNPFGWNSFSSTFSSADAGVPRIAVNSTGQIVLGSRASGMQSIAFYDGSAWSELNSSNDHRGTSDIWAAPTGEFLISKLFDNGNVFRTGTSTATFGTLESIKGNLPNTNYRALSATGLDNVFVATDSGLYRSVNAGGAVGDVSWTSLDTTRFDALHVVSDTFAVLGGLNGLVAYWNGSSVETLTTPFANQVNDVFGFSANSIWAVGNEGLAQYWDGTEWTALDLPGNSANFHLNAIDVNANGVGFIVGSSTINSNDGVVWTTAAIPEPGTLMLMGLGFSTLLLTKLFRK